MKQFKKLNKKPLKIYYEYNSKSEYQYFQFKGRRYRLDWFYRLDTPYFPKAYLNDIPDYINGVYYDCMYYVGIVEGYEPKVNVYVESSKGI